MTPEESIRKYPNGCLCYVVCRHDPGDIIERLDTVFGCWSYGHGKKLPDGRRLCMADNEPCDAEVNILKYSRLKTWWMRAKEALNAKPEDIPCDTS